MTLKKNHLLSYSIILGASLLLSWYIMGNTIFHLDQIMFNGYADGLKNHYTFIYQALYGQGIHFEGMNYPYGDHVTYTDGQPLLMFIHDIFGWITHIRAGIFTINILVLLSMLATPIVIFKILRFYKLPYWYAIIGALFIAFHSPQLHRIGAHYSLSYAFAIPLCFYQYLLFFEDKKPFRLVMIGVIAIIMGLLHPYYTLIFFLFSGTILAVSMIRMWVLHQFQRSEILLQLLTTLIPFLAVFLFIILTDNVDDRIKIPYGSRYYITKIHHIFFPFKGYISGFWRDMFPYTVHTEGDVYLGMALGITLLIMVFKFLRTIRINGINAFKTIISDSHHWLLMAAIPVMCVAMGAHEDILSLFSQGAIHPKFAQFRSLARLSWIFYFMVAPWLLKILYDMIVHSCWKTSTRKIVFGLVISSFIVDTHSNLQHIRKSIDKYSTTFDESKHTPFDADRYQAIIALPYFHVGSEKLNLDDKISFPKAVATSLMSGIPMVNTMMSRTSIGQTYKQLALFSPSARNESVLRDFPTNKPFLFIVRKKYDIPQRELDLLKTGTKVFAEEHFDYYEVFPDTWKTNPYLPKSNDELLYSSGEKISSADPYKKEEIVLVNGFLTLEYDSLLIEVENTFTNRIYSMPEVIIRYGENEEKQRISGGQFEMRNGNMVGRFPLKNSTGTPLEIRMKGLDIEVVDVRIYGVTSSFFRRSVLEANINPMNINIAARP